MTQMTQVQDAIFAHQMFCAESRNSSYGIDHIRKTEATWNFSVEEVEQGLVEMECAGLVSLNHDGRYWQASIAGKKLREKRWHELGLRHPALIDQRASLTDVVLSLVICGGVTVESDAPETLPAAALNIYLYAFQESAIELAVQKLVEDKLIVEVSELFRWTERDLAATAEGRIRYAKTVVPSLGLQPPKTILGALSEDAVSSPFGALGFDPEFTANLQFRWEEAARCRTARAWLAVAVLQGSILEAILLAALVQYGGSAKASSKWPKANGGVPRPLDALALSPLLEIAADIGLIEPTLAEYGHALRDTRNLIHPQKQIKENKYPDAIIADISSRVVQGVIASLVAGRGA